MEIEIEPNSTPTSSNSNHQNFSSPLPVATPATPNVEQQQQNELRRLIFKINQNPDLNAEQKAKQIQKIMMQQYEQHKRNKMQVETKPEVPAGENLGCKHYQRGCQLQAKCCGKWFICRLCHDEQSEHQMNRHETEKVMCLVCQHEQPPAQDCENCSARFGTYYCETCRLFDNDPLKNIFHCDKCGICRIGKREDYFHCDKCNACLSMDLVNKHRCIERSLECDCPICGENMFHSTQPVMFMPCGHSIHFKCHQEHTKNSYQCPICWKSLSDMTPYFKQIDQMLKQHQMPPEYENIRSIVLCNDCEKKSKTKYHFLYHKCQACGSYNTKILNTVEEVQGSISNEVIFETVNGEIRPRSSSAISQESRRMVPDDNEGRHR